ncbi:hypothetical protein HDU81_009698 [Chytriomyces hyalinus]|nr:hypothetical protein HDU81_009698 [Chytriomyces hyalinus]
MTLPLNAPVLWLSYSVLSINAMLLLAVIGFIAGPETHGSGKKLSLKMLASPFNIQLILISLSLIGVFSCLIVKSTHLFQTETNYLSALQILFSAVFKSCFLFYSWGRGSSVIESVWPKASRTFQFIIWLHPILIFAPVIPSVIFIVCMSQPIGSAGNLPETSRIAMRVLDLTSIISVLVADLALLVCFILYIRRNTRISKTDKVAPRFLKICYYGTLANLFCVAAFFTFLVRYVTTDGLSHSPVADNTSDAIVHCFFTAVFAALFALKIVLHFDSVNEGKRKRAAIDHAKAVSLGSTSSARAISQDHATITSSKK